MKITIVAHDLPYPPFHGARVDIWRRIKAFNKFGVKLQLICWIHHAPPSEELAQMEKYVEDICFITYSRQPYNLLRRAIALFSYPLEVTSRILRGKELKNLIERVRLFQPNLIFLDGVHGGEIATNLSRSLNIPMVSRSHNIEYLYYQRLLATATGWRKLRKRLSVNHLESYEKQILKNSLRFYDISAEDLKFWQQQGFTHGRYLPPLIDFSALEELNLNDERARYDVVYLGNLYSDNNVAGITWFLQEVMPIILKQKPDIKVLIAGSNPIDKIKKLCAETDGVELKINPASALETYNSGRVLINPVAAGSGVNIKSIEMLSLGKPIVSQAQGLAGLPEELKQYFYLANEPTSFARNIIDCLRNNSELKADRQLLESFFGEGAIAKVIEDLEDLLQQQRLT